MDTRSIALTLDVENDINLPSYKGIEFGLPKILRILDQFHVKATFFVTGDVVEKFPAVIRKLSQQHEIGCHSYHHQSYQELDSKKEIILQSAKKLIEETIAKKVLGFRAPYLRVCPPLFETLRKIGFKYDSSLALFKISHWSIKPPIKEFRLIFPNVIYRFPLLNYLFDIACRLRNTPVLYFHPWEAIDIRSLLISRPRYSWNIFGRPDRWFNTGDQFLQRISNFIRYHIQHGFQFKTLKELYLNLEKAKELY